MSFITRTVYEIFCVKSFAHEPSLHVWDRYNNCIIEPSETCFFSSSKVNIFASQSKVLNK